MSLRFVIGVTFSAIFTNIAVGFEIARSHEIMQRQPIWQYMFYFPWAAWAASFIVIGLTKMAFLVVHRDRAARWTCFASFVLLTVWWTMAVLAYTAGTEANFSLLGPILILGALSSECLYLVLSSYDVLDQIRFRRQRRDAVTILVE